MTDVYKGVECPECQGRGENMEGRMYPSGHTEVWISCELCGGEGEIPEDDYLMMKLAGEI